MAILTFWKASLAIVISLSFVLDSAAESENTNKVGNPPYNLKCALSSGGPTLWNDCIRMFRLAQTVRIPNEAAWGDLEIGCDRTKNGYCFPMMLPSVITITKTISAPASTVTVTVTAVPEPKPRTGSSYTGQAEIGNPEVPIPSQNRFINLSDIFKSRNSLLTRGVEYQIDEMDNGMSDTEHEKRNFLSSLFSRGLVILSYGMCNAVVNRSGVPEDPHTGTLIPVNFTMIEQAAAQIFKRCALETMGPQALFREVSSQPGLLQASVDLIPEAAGASRVCVGKSTRC